MSFPEAVNMYNEDWEREQNPPMDPEFIEPAKFGPADCSPCQMWNEVNRLMADFFYVKKFGAKEFCVKKFCVKKSGISSASCRSAPRAALF